MGYDFHIQRIPDGGWDIWYEKMTPPELTRELSVAESSRDQERIRAVESRIQVSLESSKQRHGLVISLQEWREAVEATPRLRLSTSDTVIVNEKTGAKLSIKAQPDDVAFLDDDGQWYNTILFRPSSAVFSSNCWRPDDSLAAAVCQLARRLRANIVGDDGEEYPLEPGARQFKR